MKSRLLFAILFAVSLLFVPLFSTPAQAGIVRHVVKPVVKASAHVTAKVVRAAAKGTKAVLY